MIVFDQNLQASIDKATKVHCDNEKSLDLRGTAFFLVGSFLENGDINVRVLLLIVFL